MTQVSSPHCSRGLSLPFHEKGNDSCMRIKDMTANLPAIRSAGMATPRELLERSADAGAPQRTDVGLWKQRTPGSTDSASFWSDTRSCLKAMKLFFISPLRLFAGGRLLLFTDKLLLSAWYRQGERPAEGHFSFPSVPASLRPFAKHRLRCSYKCRNWPPGSSIPAGGAERRTPPTTHFVDQRDYEPGSGHAYRVTNRTTSAINVHRLYRLGFDCVSQWRHPNCAGPR